jgi:hypothetical protein
MRSKTLCERELGLRENGEPTHSLRQFTPDPLFFFHPLELLVFIPAADKRLASNIQKPDDGGSDS